MQPQRGLDVSFPCRPTISKHSPATTNVLSLPSLRRLHEVLSWVLEVPEHVGAGEAKITWSLRYLMDAHRRETFSGADTPKMTTRLTILKDDIQAVLPIAKVRSLPHLGALHTSLLSSSVL